MTNIKKFQLVLLTIFLSSTSMTIIAGQIYRFQDEEGVTTLSKSLPPYAAQNGYDILDDKSLHLIKHVGPALTPDQIIEEERRLAAKEKKERQAEKAAKELEERQRQQQIYDKNLRASYTSEQGLIEACQAELDYLATELDKSKQRLSSKKEKLIQLQKQAADIELSGKSISVNMEKRLIATQQEIDNVNAEVDRLELEQQQRKEQFQADLLRLRQLLGQATN